MAAAGIANISLSKCVLDKLRLFASRSNGAIMTVPFVTLLLSSEPGMTLKSAAGGSP